MAVLRLLKSSSFVTCSTGRLAGFAPLGVHVDSSAPPEMLVVCVVTDQPASLHVRLTLEHCRQPVRNGQFGETLSDDEEWVPSTRTACAPCRPRVANAPSGSPAQRTPPAVWPEARSGGSAARAEPARRGPMGPAGLGGDAGRSSGRASRGPAPGGPPRRNRLVPGPASRASTGSARPCRGPASAPRRTAPARRSAASARRRAA